MTLPANDPLRDIANALFHMTKHETQSTCGIDRIEQALRAAHRQGEISMRSRAAKESIRHGKSEEHNKGREKDDGGTCYTHLAEAIRALIPTEPKEHAGFDPCECGKCLECLNTKEPKS